MIELTIGGTIGLIKSIGKTLHAIWKFIRNKSDLKIEPIYESENYYLKVSNYGSKEVSDLSLIEKRDIEKLKFQKENYSIFYDLKDKYKNENINYVAGNIIMRLNSFENENKYYKIEFTELLNLHCNFYTTILSLLIDKIKIDMDDLIHYHRTTQSVYVMKLHGINNKNKKNIKKENILIQFNNIRDVFKIFLDVYDHLQNNSLSLGITINNNFFLKDDKIFDDILSHFIHMTCEDDEIPMDICMRLSYYIDKISQNCIVIPLNFISFKEKKIKGNEHFKVVLDNRLLIRLYAGKHFEQINTNFLQIKPYKLKINDRVFILEHTEIAYWVKRSMKKNKQYLDNNGDFKKLSWTKIKIKQKIKFKKEFIEIKKEHDKHYE